MTDLPLKIIFVIAVIVLTTTNGSAQRLDCVSDILPITEKDLLEPNDRWSDMRLVSDSVRTDILRELVFKDSLGQIRTDIDVYVVSSCVTGPDSSIELSVVLLDIDSKEEDQYVYILSRSNGQWLSRTLIAQLQTSCTSTFLRACSLAADGSVVFQQLEHSFDCEADAFLETKRLPSFRVYLDDDGTFTEILDETAPISDDE